MDTQKSRPPIKGLDRCQRDELCGKRHFGPSGFNRPDIIYTYKTLNARIIQADLLRYLIMYVHGGVYSDIDVEALRSVDHFIPKRFDERHIDMVIGVHRDMPSFKDHSILGVWSQSFCRMDLHVQASPSTDDETD